MRDFQGRTVIVTGASSGIGRAIAVELSGRGAGVVLIGRNRDELLVTERLMTGAPAHVMELDLQERADILPQIRALVEQHGRIYGLCHCAGIVETRPS